MEIGEVFYEKVYASPRPPPKISLKHDWMKELGSEVVQRPDGQVVGQEGWGPQGRSRTGGGGLARVPNLRVCHHLYDSRWHTQEGKDELRSCRGTVWSAWQKPPVRRKGGRAGLHAKGKWPPRVTGTTVFTYPGSAPK